MLYHLVTAPFVCVLFFSIVVIIILFCFVLALTKVWYNWPWKMLLIDNCCCYFCLWKTQGPRLQRKNDSSVFCFQCGEKKNKTNEKKGLNRTALNWKYLITSGFCSVFWLKVWNSMNLLACKNKTACLTLRAACTCILNVNRKIIF